MQPERPGDPTAPAILPSGPCRVILSWVGSHEDVDPVVHVARSLARVCGGRCLLLLGLDATAPAAAGGSGEPLGKGPLTPETIGRVEKKLGALYGDDVEALVVPGNPILEVRRYVRGHKVDLVVMGEQALEIEQRYGERLAGKLPCAVMTVLPPGRDFPAGPFSGASPQPHNPPRGP